MGCAACEQARTGRRLGRSADEYRCASRFLYRGPFRFVRTSIIRAWESANLRDLISQVDPSTLGVEFNAKVSLRLLLLLLRCEAEYTIGCSEGGDGATQGTREEDLQGSADQ